MFNYSTATRLSVLGVFILVCSGWSLGTTTKESVSPLETTVGWTNQHEHGIRSAQGASSSHRSSSEDAARTAVTLTGYCLLIVMASFGGGYLPSLIRLTHTRMQLMISFVGGLMLGIGLFHMLPHAVQELESLDDAINWLMIGLLAMFFLIRAFHFHQHEPVEVHASSPEEGTQTGHNNGHGHHDVQPHRLSWIGVALGLGLHTLIDGIALAAAVQAGAEHATGWSLFDVSFFGMGTFLAILLHKPLDAVSITSLMAAGGWSAGWRQVVNVSFSLMCPLGAIFFVLGLEQFSEHQHVFVGGALAFAAGTFLCISLGDLLPELELHSHHRIPLSAALLLGIGLAWGIRSLEPSHTHPHAVPVSPQRSTGQLLATNEQGQRFESEVVTFARRARVGNLKQIRNPNVQNMHLAVSVIGNSDLFRFSCFVL